MVRIRLSRGGRKNAPAYRIVVVDKKAKRDGKVIEIIGHYNPTENPKKIEYKKDRYEYWVSKGAQPSEAVVQLIAGEYEYIPYDPNEKKEEGEGKEETKIEAKETPEEDKKSPKDKEPKKEPEVKK